MGNRGNYMEHIPVELLAQGAGVLGGVYIILWRKIKSLEANGLKRIEKTVDKIESQLNEHIIWHIEGRKKGPS